VQYAYEPFGDTVVKSGSSANEIQYVGRENDGTGLYFNRARYYYPVFQRFVSEDPIGWRGGINVFSYAQNDPTNLADPTGNYPCALTFIYVSAVSASAGLAASLAPSEYNELLGLGDMTKPFISGFGASISGLFSSAATYISVMASVACLGFASNPKS
jgi:RHS repeat-associated protein